MKVLVLALLVAAVAAQQQPLQPTTTAAPAAPSFTYNDPSTWGGLCATGKAQSPININKHTAVCVRHGEDPARPHRIDFHYIPAWNLSLAHNGNTLKVGGDLGFITLGGCNPCDGWEYYVRQFHFHAPAEHSLSNLHKNGTYPLELHIVHQKRGSTGLNDLAFVAILFYVQPEGGFHERFLDSINWNFAPQNSGSSISISNWVSLWKLSESLKGEYFTYHGSLSTPPCTEDVKYFVMKNPIGITRRQLDIINNMFLNNPNFAGGRGNNRPVQPLNNRNVFWYRKPH